MKVLESARFAVLNKQNYIKIFQMIKGNSKMITKSTSFYNYDVSNIIEGVEKKNSSEEDN